MNLRHWAASSAAAVALLLAGQAQAAPPDPSESVADMGAFTSPDQESQARVAVAAAEARFQAVDAAAAELIAAHRKDCAAPRLMDALAGLQTVERDSGKYIGLASTTPAVADREAAMDVVEELDAFALDGYLRAAEGLEIVGCGPRASFLYAEILHTYTGRAYSHWRARAAERLKALKAGRPLIAR